MRTKSIAVFMISLCTLLLIPPVHADVLTLETDKTAYDRSERIIFSGTEEDGRQMVTLIIRDPSGTKVELKGDPSSDNDGNYEVVPIGIKNVFTVVGVYEASAFTASQTVADSIRIYLDYDGKNVRLVDVYDLELSEIGDKVVDEGKKLMFTATITDSDIDVEEYSLGTNAPAGASIEPKTGKFSWTPTEAQGPGAYLVDIMVNAGISEDSETIIITVNEVDEPVVLKQPKPAEETKQKPAEDAKQKPVDTKPEITEAEDEKPAPPEPKQPKEKSLGLASFVDSKVDPQHYVDRYLNEKVYRDWFDKNFSHYSSIYEAVGLPEPEMGICGVGTTLINGICTITKEHKQAEDETCFLFWCW